MTYELDINGEVIEPENETEIQISDVISFITDFKKMLLMLNKIIINHS